MNISKRTNSRRAFNYPEVVLHIPRTFQNGAHLLPLRAGGLVYVPGKPSFTTHAHQSPELACVRRDGPRTPSRSSARSVRPLSRTVASAPEAPEGVSTSGSTQARRQHWGGTVSGRNFPGLTSACARTPGRTAAERAVVTPHPREGAGCPQLPDASHLRRCGCPAFLVRRPGPGRAGVRPRILAF